MGPWNTGEHLTGLHRADMGRSRLRPYIPYINAVYENVSWDRLCPCNAACWCAQAATVNLASQSPLDRVMG
jgi:hypothetical protein